MEQEKDMDFLTMMTFGKSLSELAPEMSYHVFQVASYKYPDQVKGNSYMGVETSDEAEDQLKGLIDSSEVFKQLFDEGL